MTPQKILALQNFVGIFQKFLDFFSSNSEKNIIFQDHFSRKILLNDLSYILLYQAMIYSDVLFWLRKRIRDEKGGGGRRGSREKQKKKEE